jgi:MFS family permease
MPDPVRAPAGGGNPSSRPSSQPSVTVRVPRLLRRPEFRRFWSARAVSLFGDEVSTLAIPLVAVLTTGAGATQMGLLTAASLLPNLLFSVVAGAWVDRFPHKRRVMIGADVGRALLLAVIPLLWWSDALTVRRLCVIAFAIGTLSVLFEVAHTSLFAALVARDDYIEANMLLNGARAMSTVSGPGVGGILVQVLGAPVALLADVGSYVASALFLTGARPDDQPRTTAGSGWGVTEGLRLLARSVPLRSVLLGTTTLNLFNYMFAALFVLYVTTELGIAPATLGLILGAGAVGGLLGAAVTGRLTRRFGIGATLLASFVVFPGPLFLVPLAGGPRPLVVGMLFTAEFVAAVGVMMLDITAGAVQTAATPGSMLARMQGANRTVNYGIRPIGALLGGWLGATLGLRPALWIAVIGALAGVFWIAFSPLARQRELPEPEPHR